MIFAFLAQNEHGRALIALIRKIRACPACFPELYITCELHRAELDRLYPEHCPDANCPACAADRPPVERVPDDLPVQRIAYTCRRGHTHATPDHRDSCNMLPGVHDNGDYRA